MSKQEKINLQAPKGMSDILPEDYEIYQSVYDKAEEIAEYYGFKPIQTPHVEKTEIFTASLGETSDVVEKEMFSFKTKGGDSLCLRPEGTAGVMRAYIEHGMGSLPQPLSFWYKGSFFRHENPQKGRKREFQQFGMEMIGEERPIAEATIIQVLYLTLVELGIQPAIVYVNSRGDKECWGAYRKELLNYYNKNSSRLCKDCQRRLKTNPMRMLDCKEEKCRQLREGAPQMTNYFCPECKQHFKVLLEALEENKIPYYLDPYLVRGFDYYTRTVFEIFQDRQEESGGIIETIGESDLPKEPPLAIAGGGRYDYLAKILGRKNAAAAGGGIGVDRVVQIIKDKNLEQKQKKSPKFALIQLGSQAKYKSLMILEMLRKAKIPTIQSISKDSITGQLNLASKLKVPYVLILGQKEILENSIIVRNMDTRAQDTVPIGEVIDFIKKKL